MKDHCESEDNRPQGSETAHKSVYSASQSYCLFSSVKTCPIIALYCIFLRQVVSEYPPQVRGIGGSDDSQNESFSRCRPRGRATSCTRTVSSYGDAGWLRLLLLESPGLLHGLPVMAQRLSQALSPVCRCGVRSIVKILILQGEWNRALISAQRQGSHEGKNTTTPGCDPKSHQDTLFAREPCGNDWIDAHVENLSSLTESI